MREVFEGLVLDPMITIHEVLNTLAIILEVFGGIVIFSSAVVSLFEWFKNYWHAYGPKTESVRDLRLVFGDQIVYALEFFIAGDIIRSVLAPTLQELTKLAIIVAIRTVLHYSLVR